MTRTLELERALELAAIRLQWCAGYLEKDDPKASETATTWAQEALKAVEE